MGQEMVVFGDGSGISWTMCKQSASRSRQVTTPAPHQSFFTGWMLFLTPNQQCQGIDYFTIVQHIASELNCLQCFDTVGWATGRASGL